ncbi:ATP synthase subunit [Colletotrichum graminicola M1.001]|uniref:ATP synthase subunit n=1 Tax=Colletotrichum graminicola (strain M1.001 / M2 / FGSC 10212) TaxID=645133 RepID=E3Q792_COLGM|nr:ATP synthase subunit [Colletotrichum graminicola M1.001]EFQ26730.1 ATP synthase subunit [Colletotrichum graminicola M1.001]
MSHQPLTDDQGGDGQVSQELRKMTAFIKQEAMEKAREIEIKANEEFAIEKSKLVRQETDAIDSQYEKKFKQAQMSQQITRSTASNKTRLKVLGARQELLDNIFEDARKKLSSATKDKGKYQATLKNLIIEGLYALAEPEVVIRARKADFDVVKKAIEDAVKEYKKEVGKDTSAKIDEPNPLPAERHVSPPRLLTYLSLCPQEQKLTKMKNSAGGVFIVGGKGKIEINNTFEERLNILQDTGLPAVRETLFGKNPNRRFTD